MPRLGTHRQWTPLAQALTATGDKWTLLIVLALAPGTIRLSCLKDRLPGISTGVLEQHVQRMVALGLLTRRRFRAMPPRVELELTDCGRELVPIAASLARWGMRNQWSAPQPSERVQADALLRQLPALLNGKSDLRDGAVEAILTTDSDRVHHRFRIERGHLVAPDVRDVDVAACVEGDEAAWIAALGPARDSRRLSFKGRRQLAKRILDVLPQRASTSHAPQGPGA